jgi:hypothetical protein
MTFLLNLPRQVDRTKNKNQETLPLQMQLIGHLDTAIGPSTKEGTIQSYSTKCGNPERGGCTDPNLRLRASCNASQTGYSSLRILLIWVLRVLKQKYIPKSPQKRLLLGHFAAEKFSTRAEKSPQMQSPLAARAMMGVDISLQHLPA